MNKKQKNIIYNLIFVLVCGSLFLFLYKAPPSTTALLPHDADHEQFFSMKKKKAEKQCEQCHNQDGVAPLPEEHPPKYRCLFCHKRK